MDSGRCRAIGLSDISLNELLPIYESARIKPAVAQVEAHPYLPETELLEFCKQKDIVFLAFVPLGHGLRPGPLEDPVISAIGFHSTRQMIMKSKPYLEHSMQEEQIREALNKHWQASAAGDANAEHDIYDEDAVCDYPQSGERILGRSNLQALRSHHPGKPSGFNVKRILGKGDLWITEYTITYQGRPAYTVSIMEFRNGKVVHETQYFADPFEAPAWRSQWVQRFE